MSPRVKKTVPSSQKSQQIPDTGDVPVAQKNITQKQPVWSWSRFVPIVVLAIMCFLVMAVVVWFRSPTQTTPVTISELVQNYKTDQYAKIEVRDQNITATLRSPNTTVLSQNNLSLLERSLPGAITTVQHTATLPLNDTLKDIGIDISIPTQTTIQIIDTTSLHFWVDLVPTLIFWALFLGFSIFLLFRILGGNGWPMGFMKNKSKRYEPAKGKVMFTDVAGLIEEKQDLQEFVDFMKNPAKYKKLGAKIPRGILMSGAPGTGKTLLARAVAGESDVPFYSVSGSEFMEMFVGVGVARVRDLFAEARANAPAIIFIDEIDAIGKRRSNGFGNAHEDREQTLNQILTEMDGFDNDTNIIVMGATNRAEILDKALLRPGRFDRKVVINLPNLEDRFAILQVHARNKPLANDVDLHRIASATIGFAGADLENLLNEAAILAGRENHHEITQKMLQTSIEKIVIGNTKKSHVMTEFEKKLTAYHEVGHAITGKMTANSDPVHKISIISRGATGGVTWFLPEQDKTYITKAKMLDELTVYFGGRAAEEIFFGSDMITTGASSDIERATSVARSMVMKYGFDAEIWLENIAHQMMEDGFGTSQDMGIVSDETKLLVDTKVRALLSQAYEMAKKIITDNRELHEKIAAVLMEKQEMLRDEFDSFFQGMKVPEKVML